MEEVWKDIKGYEGKYQVSNLGRVRSLDYLRTGKIKILKYSINNKGYYIVYLSKNGIVKTRTIHRLVAEAFIPNPDNLPCCDHINTIVTDNKASNLRWCTQWSNMMENPNSRKKLKKTSKPVIQCSLDQKPLIYWESISETKKMGFSRQAVSFCCLGKRKTHKGFIWKFA